MDAVLLERGAAQMFAVELDDLTLGRLRAAVRGMGLALSPVSRDLVLDRAAQADGPIIVLLEWAEADEGEQQRLCQALRAAARTHGCHILALGGLSDQAALFRAAEAAADDVLSRPFGADLVFRLRQGLRLAQSSRAHDGVRRALDEALRSAGGGEVAVRSGDVTATIHVQDGHVVWADVSSAPASMEEVVREGGVSLDREMIEAVKEQCRGTGVHFMDVLVSWEIIDEARAREAVRSFVAGRVKLALDLPDAVALYLPRPRSHSERLHFPASEIPSLQSAPHDAPVSSRFEAGPPSLSRATSDSLSRATSDSLSRATSDSLSRATLPLSEITMILDEAVEVDGVVGAAILDRRTGASLFQAGAEMDPGVAWSQLSTLAALGPSAEDVLASTGERCFVTRPLRLATSLALFVVLSLSATTVGLARASIARIAGPRAAVAAQALTRGHAREG